MICPCEKKGETSVVDSRPTEDGTAIRRRRLCSCGERFTTFERIQYREIMVIKKNGRKSPFDRDKLSKSIYIALKKRPIDTDTIEKFITKNPPPSISGRQIKFKHVHFGGIHPTTFIIHSNQDKKIPKNYLKYLENSFRTELDLKSIQLKIIFRKSDNPYEGKKNKLSERQVKKRKRLIKHIKKSKK